MVLLMVWVAWYIRRVQAHALWSHKTQVVLVALDVAFHAHPRVVRLRLCSCVIVIELAGTSLHIGRHLGRVQLSVVVRVHI